MGGADGAVGDGWMENEVGGVVSMIGVADGSEALGEIDGGDTSPVMKTAGVPETWIALSEVAGIEVESSWIVLGTISTMDT